jgi:ATP-dependent Lon protease
VLAQGVDDPSKLADLVGSHLDFDVAGKQEILEELDVRRRLERVLGEVSREQDAHKVESEIREKVQTDIGRTQRDYMLRQQLEAIRQELGESEDSETEIENLRGRIEAAGMPEEAHEQATRELERLAQMPSGGRRARRDPHLSRVDGRAALEQAVRGPARSRRGAAGSSTRTTGASTR